MAQLNSTLKAPYTLSIKEQELCRLVALENMSVNGAATQIGMSLNIAYPFSKTPEFKEEVVRLRCALTKETIKKLATVTANKAEAECEKDKAINMAKLASPAIIRELISLTLTDEKPAVKIEAGKEVLQTAGMSASSANAPLVQLNITIGDGLFNALKKEGEVIDVPVAEPVAN